MKEELERRKNAWLEYRDLTLERHEWEERVKQEREKLEEEEKTKRKQQEDARQKAIEEELQPQSTAVAG